MASLITRTLEYLISDPRSDEFRRNVVSVKALTKSAVEDQERLQLAEAVDADDKTNIENEATDKKQAIDVVTDGILEKISDEKCVRLFNLAKYFSLGVLAVLLVISHVENDALQYQNNELEGNVKTLQSMNGMLHGDVSSLVDCRAAEAQSAYFSSEWFPSTVLCDGAGCLSKSAPEKTLKGCVKKTHEIIKAEIKRRKEENTTEGDPEDIEVLEKYKKHLAGLMMLWHLTTMETNNNVKLRF